jgi:DNA-binding XRE family transcriptional regulator
MTLGQQVKSLRQKWSLSQHELANRVGCSISTITRMERDISAELFTVVDIVRELNGTIVLETKGKAVTISASSLKEAPVARQKIYRR